MLQECEKDIIKRRKINHCNVCYGEAIREAT